MELTGRLGRVDDPMLVIDPDTEYQLLDLQATCRDLRNGLLEQGLMDDARKSLEVLAAPGTRAQRVLDNLLGDHPNPMWVGSL